MTVQRCLPDNGGTVQQKVIGTCATENLSPSDIHVKWLKHQEVAQEGKMLFPCVHGSLKLFNVPQHLRREMLANEW